ncbi:MAG: segregation/condensation protein A, partial [Pseudonocardiaceae bacterium]
AAMRRYPRSVALEERFAGLLPEVLLGVDAVRFAETAAAVFGPKPPPPMVSLEHLHAPRVSVREHAAALRRRLAREGQASFSSLVADCGHTREVVARFLALLDLYRAAVVVFDQTDPLGELCVQWIGGSEQTAAVAGPDGEPDNDGEDDEDYR